MQLLLDTHAALWWWTDDKLLSRRSYSAIEDDRNICHVSIASIWECVIKCATKRMRLPAPACEFFIERMKDNAFSLLPLDLRHLRALEGLPDARLRDPFDRLLAAQAGADRLTLVSADKAFDALRVKRLW